MRSRPLTALATRYSCPQDVSRQIQGQRRRPPGKRNARASVPIIVNQQFGAEALRVDDEPFGAVRSQADDLTNDSVALNPDRCQIAFGIRACSNRVRTC